ncbi:MAG: AraC family transcriptional regulator [Gammaproteobacteria bacterium]|nr:AraC family transcriptional regulator [Gammaproteobacteria bacterium]
MARTKGSTPAQYVIILLDLAAQRGADSAALLEGTGLAAAGLANIGARVDEEDFARIVENAYRLTNDPALGLHLGARLNLSAHATVGQAFMTCETLGQVLHFFLKYYHILAANLELDYQRHDGRCWLIPNSPYETMGVEFSHEMLFSAIVNTMQFLVNQPVLQFRLELPYPEPDYVDEYHALFGKELYFNCPEGRISFAEEWLNTTLPSSNPALLDLYERECQRLLADLEEQDTLTEQTLQLLRKLEGHYPQMPLVADMLNFSPRTYRRRLEEEQGSFQQLLDQVRTEHASHYLKSTQLPLASIAYMVGFNDVSNFRRAYIRWTGQTPREARGANDSTNKSAN